MEHSLEIRYRDQFARVNSLDGAAHLLTESARALGWDRAAFRLNRDVNNPRNTDGGFIGVAMGWPVECVGVWNHQGMAQECPVTQRCARSTDSFVYRCSPGAPEWSGTRLTDSQSSILAHLGRFMAGAAAVPVHRPGGKAGYVIWASEDGDRLAELHGRSYDETFLISHAFMRRVDEITGASRRASAEAEEIVLSAREIECLTWAAYGKTGEEIAMIIKRSHETARFHLRNAMNKLNASNRTHAVAIACSRGLIAAS